MQNDSPTIIKADRKISNYTILSIGTFKLKNLYITLLIFDT